MQAVKAGARLWTELRRTTYEQRGLLAIFVLVFVAALYVRYRLVGVITPDFTDFLQPWFLHMQQYGIPGLGDDFSNYNTPYLVLLYLASFLPFSDLLSVKLVSIGFDVVLAGSVWLVVRHYRPASYAPYGAFIAIMIAPVVLQNGAMWGQCDSIYTSFLVLSFYAYLKDRLNLAWILWGVAFALKLQAIFFAPFLLFITLYHRRAWLGAVYGGLTTILLSLPPALFGKSLSDTFSVYVSQSAPIRTDFGLAWFAPTAYQWVSNRYFLFVRGAGIIMGGIVALGIVALAFLRRYDQRTILMIATLTLLAVPFFLPTIHERYLFGGEIFLIMLAFVLPRYLIAAVTMQIITTMAYVTYFSQGNENPPIAFPVLSALVLVIIGWLATDVYRRSEPLAVTAVRSTRRR